LKTPLVEDLIENCVAFSEEDRIQQMIISQQYRHFLENEKAIYRHLGNTHDYIIKYLGLCSDGIKMPFMSNGIFHDYIPKHKLPLFIKASWIRSIADAIRYAHANNVILMDVASRNILIDSNMSVYLCNFSDSILIDIAGRC
jgi:serine/threonine protein kinase